MEETLKFWLKKIIQDKEICISALDDDLKDIYESEGIDYNERERLIMYMRICNRSPQDIAGKLNVTLNSIKSEISKGSSKVIKILSRKSTDIKHHIAKNKNVTNFVLKQTLLNLGYGEDEQNGEDDLNNDRKQPILKAIIESEYTPREQEIMIEFIKNFDLNNC